MIVIGIDPHKSTHTATALDPATNSDLGSIRIEATLTGYKRLIVWAKAWPTGLGGRERRRTRPPPGPVATGPRRGRSSTFRPPPPPGSGNSPAAADGRTTASTPPQRPVSPSCRAMPARWTRRARPISWRCSMSVERICLTAGPVSSISCTRCCDSCSPAAHRPRCPRPRPRPCCGASVPARGPTALASDCARI